MSKKHTVNFNKNRFISFRAWNRESKSLYFVSCLNLVKGVMSFYAEDQSIYHNSDKMLLMQYAGLQDKNDQEIFEGDICFVKAMDWLGVIKFDERVGAFLLFVKNKTKKRSVKFIGEPLSDVYQYEVIGNIFENPELLENKE